MKYCDGCGVTHTSLMCFNKPRKPLIYRPKPKRVSEQTKKHYRSLKAAYLIWYQRNKPDGSNLYYCFYCHRAITNDEQQMEMGIQPMTLDHYHPRSTHKDLVYDPDNLVACCYPCNSEKGSIDGDLYMQKIGGI